MQRNQCIHSSHTGFVVEKLCDKRLVKKNVQYLVKWKQRPDNELCWIQKNTLKKWGCVKLMQRFEKQRDNGRNNGKEENEPSTSAESDVLDFSNIPNSEAKCILAAVDVKGSLCYLVHWKDNSEACLVPSTFISEKYPKLLIEFFEQRMEWHTNGS